MSYTTADIPKKLLGRLKGDVPPHYFSGDGLTGAPDYWPPLIWNKAPDDMRPAGLIHDFAYSVGGCRRERLEADENFYHNLVACGMPPFWAGAFYRRVRLWGVAHFTWHKSCRPNRLLAYAAAFVGRWMIPLPKVRSPQ